MQDFMMTSLGNLDLNTLRSLITLILFVLFIALIFQVYSKKNKRHFEQVGEALFDDGDERLATINSTTNSTTNSTINSTNKRSSSSDQMIRNATKVIPTNPTKVNSND